jgi:hypothetical protein
MSALKTARDVIHWAINPDGPPPQGDLFDLEHLLKADADLLKLLSDFAGLSATRLGLIPPESDTTDGISADTLCLAAAIGGMTFQPADAMKLLDVIPTPDNHWQRIVCHGLIFPAIQSHFLGAPQAEALLMRSPLTAVLFLPPKGGEDAAINLCKQLTEIPQGRKLLIQHFADPESHAGQFSWRGRLMASLRLSDTYRDFVLEIYETAIAIHGKAWRQRIQQANMILSGAEPLDSELNLALSIGRWWDPMRGIYQSHHQAIRERHYLDFHTYLDGIRLANAVHRLREGLQ